MEHLNVLRQTDQFPQILTEHCYVTSTGSDTLGDLKISKTFTMPFRSLCHRRAVETIVDLINSFGQITYCIMVYTVCK